MDDGLDEDAQVLSGLPGLVALQADAQPGRARLVEGDLVHQLLPAVLQHHAAGFLTFLEEEMKEGGLKDTGFNKYLFLPL